MQVYRGMDIGTAKPTVAEQARIPHHMLDIADPAQPYSVAEYREGAQAVIEDILAGACAGTGGRHGSALACPQPGADAGQYPRMKKCAAATKRCWKREGKQVLHDRLRQVDPVAAGRLHINDTRRVIRAGGVGRDGQPFSDQRKPEDEGPYRFVLYAPDWPREALYQRIDRRVDDMMALGLMAEVEGLLKRGLTPDMQSMQGLGYKELAPCLTDGADVEEAVSLIKRRTRNYAKRQLTWFRPDGRIRWPLRWAWRKRCCGMCAGIWRKYDHCGAHRAG